MAQLSSATAHKMTSRGGEERCRHAHRDRRSPDDHLAQNTRLKWIRCGTFVPVFGRSRMLADGRRAARFDDAGAQLAMVLCALSTGSTAFQVLGQRTRRLRRGRLSVPAMGGTTF